MNYRHAIDEQHHIAPSVTAQRVRSLETRLSGNLIATLSGTDFTCIENLQINFLAVIVGIGGVVAFDAYLSAIDKHIHGVWAVAQIHLIDDLAHLTCGKRTIAQFIDVSVVVEENLGPVLNQIFFCGLYKDFLFPTMMGEKVNQGLFKLTFLDEILYVVYIIHIYFLKGLNDIYTNILSRQAALICFSFSRRWVWREICLSRLQK